MLPRSANRWPSSEGLRETSLFFRLVSYHLHGRGSAQGRSRQVPWVGMD